MTPTDPFTEAAEDAAGESARGFIGSNDEAYGYHCGFTAGAEWARTHLAAQEPDDAEVLAALNADYALRFGPSNRPADSLDPYGGEHVQIMRAALTAAYAARRDEEKR